MQWPTSKNVYLFIFMVVFYGAYTNAVTATDATILQ